jgi:hypothetical protein
LLIMSVLVAAVAVPAVAMAEPRHVAPDPNVRTGSTPTPTPTGSPAVTPTPSATPTPTATPSGTPTPAPTPAPAGCATLTAAPKDGNLAATVYTFSIKTRPDDLSVRRYAIDFGQGRGQELFRSAKVDHDFGQAGTYRVKASVQSEPEAVQVCELVITVGGSEQAAPAAAGQTLGTSTEHAAAATSAAQPRQLAETGPESVLGGAVGLGALGYATRYYLQSRRSLRTALKNPLKR